jgi:CDP-glycerol glycerophosphotransferase
MPVYNVERYLGDCLESVLAQDFGSFEVIAVDDGSTDRSAAILAGYAARDRRIRTLRQTNSGQGPARNLAVSIARGEYITFVDSDDIVPPGSFAFLVSALRRSWSEFAVTGVRRIEPGRSYRPSWTVVMNEHDRVGITIDDFPAAMTDVVAHHRIFRRRFWTEAVGGFSAGVYEDHVPMVAAYLRARRFDVLSRVTYEWRLREEGTSTGQQKHNLQNLVDRIAVKAEARDLVEREASAGVRAGWVGRVLDIDFPPYLDHALRADDHYRRTLRDALSEYTAIATREALTYVRVQQKVRTHLAAVGAWEDLEIAQRFFRQHGSIPPTMIREDGVAMVENLSPQLSRRLPAHVLALSGGESRLQVCAQRVEWLSPTQLRLTGWAVIRGIDLSNRDPALAIWLVSTGGTRVELPIEQIALPEATRWVNWAHGSFDSAGFSTVVDADTLHDSGPWRIHARVTVDGVVREGGLHHALAGSSASRAAIGSTAAAAGAALVPRYDGEYGLTFAPRRGRDRLKAAAISLPRRQLEVTAIEVSDDVIRMRTRTRQMPHTVAVMKGRIRVPGTIERSGWVKLPSRIDGGVLPTGVWHVETGDGRSIRVTPALAQSLPFDVVTATHRIRLALDGSQGIRVELGPPLFDDEVGARAQQLLRHEYARDERDVLDAVLIIPAAGEGSDDGADATLGALDRAADEMGLDRWWAVSDLASMVPDGATPVVIGSRNWYRCLAAARVVATESDLEWWFSKRPHQNVVRTFEDAAVPVGRSAWREAGYTPARVADEVAGASGWDAIVVPATTDEDRFRHEFDFGGLVFTSETPAQRILDEVTAQR